VAKSKSSKIISVTLAITAVILTATPVFAATAADAVLNNTILQGVTCAQTGAETPLTVAGQSSSYKVAPKCDICDFIKIFVNASNLIISVSGAIAILIFVYAGIMYLTISFSPGNLEKAKNSIKAAIIGLAFIFGGYTIMNFVIITFVGGESSMGGFYKITGQTNWGVCQTTSFQK